MPMADTKVRTSVSLKAETDKYLETLAREIDRPKSWIVETLIKQFAERRRNGAGKTNLDPSQELQSA